MCQCVTISPSETLKLKDMKKVTTGRKKKDVERGRAMIDILVRAHTCTGYFPQFHYECC